MISHLHHSNTYKRIRLASLLFRDFLLLIFYIRLPVLYYLQIPILFAPSFRIVLSPDHLALLLLEKSNKNINESNWP